MMLVAVIAAAFEVVIAAVLALVAVAALVAVVPAAVLAVVASLLAFFSALSNRRISLITSPPPASDTTRDSISPTVRLSASCQILAATSPTSTRFRFTASLLSNSSLSVAFGIPGSAAALGLESHINLYVD